MSKMIALRTGFDNLTLNIARLRNHSSILKQQALMFDQIGILNLNEEINWTPKSSLKKFSKERESLKLDLEFLKEAGVIFEPTRKISSEFSKTTIGQYYLSKLQDAFEEYVKSQAEQPPPKDNLHQHEDFSRYADYLLNIVLAKQKFDTLSTRILSLDMQTTQGVTVVTTLPAESYMDELPTFKKSVIAQIALNKLPLPRDETPWEQIIDYRNDPENQKNLLNLRRWFRKISTENLSLEEIEEELEWLINEFHTHMKLHRMKANTETLEVMVKAPLEIIENLLKLKLSKLPAPLFSLKKRQINLLEAELNAPGREMAYIIKTRDAFQTKEGS